MFNEDYDYEDYFEPGIIDTIVIEAIKKAKEQVKENIKINLEDEFNKNKVEKEKLDKEGKALNARIRDVSKREREVRSKEENMLDSFAKDFFKDSNTDVVKIGYDSKMIEKCDKCDEKRYITVTDIFDREHKVACECSKRAKTWKYKKPHEVVVGTKGNRRWDSVNEKYTSFIFVDDEDYRYSFTLGSDIVYCSLDEFKEYAKDRDSFYGTYIISSEVAQQCIDYLNNRKRK